MSSIKKFASLAEIAAEVRVCTLCSLCQQRTNAVPGDGNPTASVMFIGEGPGEQEDKQGLPFVGRAGKLLDELLRSVNLWRQDVYITNVVKCRPPANRDPSEAEVLACNDYLKAQIELINPRVIVPLGRHALNHFSPGAKISQARGNAVPFGPRLLFPIYHPAAGLRNPTMLSAIKSDFQKLPGLLASSFTAGLASEPKPDTPKSDTDDPKQSDFWSG